MDNLYGLQGFPWSGSRILGPNSSSLFLPQAAVRCCTLAILSGNFNIYICVLEMTAVISEHEQGRNGASILLFGDGAIWHNGKSFPGSRVVTVSGIHPPIPKVS